MLISFDSQLSKYCLKPLELMQGNGQSLGNRSMHFFEQTTNHFNLIESNLFLQIKFLVASGDFSDDATPCIDPHPDRMQ